MNVSDGLKLFESGKILDSIKTLEEALINEKNDISGFYTLGVGYFRTKEFIKAKSSFETVLKLDHRNHLAHYYLGLIYERENKIEDAILEYKIANTINPDFLEARKKLEAMNVINEEVNPVSQQQVEKPMPSFDEKTGPLVAEDKRGIRSYSFWFLIGFLTIPIFGFWLLILLIIAVNARMTKYTIYEKRIDVAYGFFSD